MLYIIGLGLDKEDMSIKALNSIKKCKRIFMETYTSDLPYSFKDIEKFLYKETKGKLKKIDIVDRKFVEEDNMMFEEAKRHDVALLVPGDPLSATTHSELIVRAEKFDVQIKVIHAPSIMTAIGETGLQLYKFGKTASIPKWQKSFEPESFYDIVQQNKKINAHTLLLIDIGLQVSEALKELKEVAKRRNDKIWEVIICSNLGTDKAEIKIGKIDALINKSFKLPACIILPAPMHFFEQEFFKKIKKKKKR